MEGLFNKVRQVLANECLEVHALGAPGAGHELPETRFTCQSDIQDEFARMCSYCRNVRHRTACD